MEVHANMSTSLLNQSDQSTHHGTKSSNSLAGFLRPGKVYRREDLLLASNAVDRHLRELLENGSLKKLAQGLYYKPRESTFGSLPPDDSELVKAFLRDDHFLIFSPSGYNSLGLGTTQLYNTTIVYNHKRHGHFTFGNRTFDFRVKPRFPKKLTEEFLLVDLLNNINELAEDKATILGLVRRKCSLYQTKFKHALNTYASVATKKLVTGWVDA
jgi:hypothetical protein